MDMVEERLHWLDIGQLSDIPVQGSRRVRIDGTAVAVFRTAADKVFALEDKCPHAGGPLSEGIVHGDCVTCPLHNWDISLADGRAKGEDADAVQNYHVKQENGRLLLAHDHD